MRHPLSTPLEHLTLGQARNPNPNPNPHPNPSPNPVPNPSPNPNPNQASAHEPEAAPAYVAFPEAGASARLSLSPARGGSQREEARRRAHSTTGREQT